MNKVSPASAFDVVSRLDADIYLCIFIFLQFQIQLLWGHSGACIPDEQKVPSFYTHVTFFNWDILLGEPDQQVSLLKTGTLCISNDLAL